MREECATLAVKWGASGGAAGWRSAATELRSMDSLSLSLPLARILLRCGKYRRTHSGLRPQVPRTHKHL